MSHDGCSNRLLSPVHVPDKEMESASLLSHHSGRDPTCRQTFQKYAVGPVLFLYSLYFSGSTSLISQFVADHFEHIVDPSSHTSTHSDGCLKQSDTYASSVESQASLWLMYMNIASTVSLTAYQGNCIF